LAVIVYIGAYHIDESETPTGVYRNKEKRRPLGYFLNQYTNKKNFSVYMGHPPEAIVSMKDARFWFEVPR